MVARWNLKFIIAPSSEVLNLSNWVRRPTHCMMDDSTTQCNPVDELALVLGARYAFRHTLARSGYAFRHTPLRFLFFHRDGVC